MDQGPNPSRRAFILDAAAVFTAAAFDAWFSKSFGGSLLKRIERDGITDLNGTTNIEFFQREAVAITKFIRDEYDIELVTPDTIEVDVDKQRFLLDPVRKSALILLALRELKDALLLFPPSGLHEIFPLPRRINLTGRIFDGVHRYGPHGYAKIGKKGVITLQIEDLLTADRGTMLQSRSARHELIHRIYDAELAHPFYQTYITAIYSTQQNFKAAYDSTVRDTFERGGPFVIRPGFSTFYGQYNPVEDVAEILTCAMDPRDPMWQRVPNDPVLKKKITYLEEAFKVSLNLHDQYWTDLRLGAIDFEYWQRHGMTLKKGRR